MKLYWNMIPSPDKIRNSFTVSVGRQIVFGKFLYFGEYDVWALRVIFPLKSKFCKQSTRYTQHEMGAFPSNIQEVALTPYELGFLGTCTGMAVY